jgi:hypothetical protein
MSSIPLPKSYLEKILGSINRLTESCVLNVSGENLYSICCSPDTTIILYAKAKLPVSVNPAVQLNLISIKKLLSGLECLGNDGIFSLEYDVNSIKCQVVDDKTEEKTFFKYHLVDNSVIKEAPVSINKISSLKFDTEFIIPVSKIKQIMAGYAFVADSTKIYFSTDGQKVLAEINDKTQPNVDNINLIASKEFSGNPISSPMALNMEVFKILTSCRSDIKVKINSQYKVFVFQSMEEESIELKYIISALVK